MAVSEELKSLAQQWIDLDVNPDTRKQIEALLENADVPKLESSLGSRIAFGTAGLRSSMEAGFAHMNDVTVLQASQGLVAYLDKHKVEIVGKSPSLVVGYDHRHHSQRFAELTATAALVRGFTVYYLGSINELSKESMLLSNVYNKDSDDKYDGIFTESTTYDSVVHTPMVPFSIDHYHADGGVMITASHNPANDNGYKVYYGNGCQIIPPHDEGIAELIDHNLIPWDSVWDVKAAFAKAIALKKLISIHDEAQDAYIESLKKLVVNPKLSFDFVYTPIHGVGNHIFQRLLELFEFDGLNHVVSVACQKDPNPDFPTVSFPNPEEKGALDEAIAEAGKLKDVQLVVLNDPDADRFSVAVKSKSNGEWKQLTGNEIGFLFAMWIVEKSAASCDFSKMFMINSTVSSQILKSMAKIHGFHYEDTLTGFKWIGNRAISLRDDGFTVSFGYEEAIGYMFGQVSDKDGIAAACEWLQMYEKWFSSREIDPLKKLNDGYEKYGWFKECNGYYKLSDLETMPKIFNAIRTEYPKGANGEYPDHIGDLKVTSWRDLTVGYDSSTSDCKPTLHVDPKAHMITVEAVLDDETVRFTCRGSGTEPKLKVYIEAQAKSGQKSTAVAKRCWEILRAEWFQPSKYGLQEVV